MTKPLTKDEEREVERRCAEMESAGHDPEALSLMSRREEVELQVRIATLDAERARAERLLAECKAWRKYDDLAEGKPIGRVTRYADRVIVKARRLRAANEEAVRG